jgi:hypothetical protein
MHGTGTLTALAVATLDQRWSGIRHNPEHWTKASIPSAQHAPSRNGRLFAFLNSNKEFTMTKQASKTPALPRRGFIKVGAWAAGSEGQEKTALKFAIIPLTDCVPIVNARAKGFFRAHGFDVAASEKASWAHIR